MRSTNEGGTMPVIAIIGAGPGLGLSVARTFGAQGFDVALISRDRHGVDALVDQLTSQGVTAAGFTADVADHAALTGALQAAADRFGAIDVLEFSPYAGLDVVQPEEVTVDGLQEHLDVQLHGAVTAVRAVLPAMIERGAGTLLFTMGIGSIAPVPMLASMNPAQAALRNWATNLHQTLGGRGIQAASLVVGVGITDQSPDHPHRHPDAVAELLWLLHTERDRVEYVLTGD
jgi:NADP-dependent 3-hydroxy acid dehydrogenase YdfG